MAEVIEQGVESGNRPPRASGAAGEAALHHQLVDRAERRLAAITWSTTLSAEDLACLLSVIEQQVLPRLLRSYRPNERKRLERAPLNETSRA